jgi:hypothetical protein
LAVAAYHLSVFGVFFLLPLQWVRVRRGEGPFWLASVLAAAGIGAVEAAIKAWMHSPWTVLDTAVLAFPLVLIAGWVAIVAMERLGWRFLYRLLTVTAVAGLVLFPLIASLLSQAAFNQVLGQSFDEVWKQASQTPGLDAPGLMDKLDRTGFFDLLKEAFLGSFLLVFFLFWAVTDRMSRAFEPATESKTLKDFFVPPQAAWVLLGLWALILVQGLLAGRGVKWDWGFVQYVVLNAALVALVVHALAGWGIVQSLMERWRWPRIAQMGVRVLLVCTVLVPGTGQITVLVALPLLAVLELWVNFRNRTQGVGL